MMDSDLPLNQILQGDCIEILRTLPEKSVDLIFADPPYNLQLRRELWRPNRTKVDAVDDEWDQFASFQAYDAFTRAWLSACHRVLKDTGTIWVIGSYHNIYRVGTIVLDLGFWILNDIVWVKTNPMPNFRGVRFANSHETLIWAKKSEPARYTFNYHAMKALNSGKQMRSDWLIPICSGAERIRVNGAKAHSTQKPEALLRRVILSSSKPGEIVLDPFSGSGTTAVVAKQLQRQWIGIEQDPFYVQVAQERIAKTQVEVLPADVDEQRKIPRTPFVTLLDHGLLTAGQSLYFQRDRKLAAEIQANGKVRCNGYEGSIHQVGRQIQGGSPCNGWENWYYENAAGELVVIDTLRELARRRENRSG